MPANVTAPTTEKTIESLLGLVQRIGKELGSWAVSFFEKLLRTSLPSDLEASAGILLILTVFLAGAEFSKKILWFLVCIGWILFLMRIVVGVLNTG